MTSLRAPVGRAVELERLRGLVEDAANGRAGTLLISGEAGVGKTALTHEACGRVQSPVRVLWASCLPMTSLAVPLLPLITALRRWSSGGAGSSPDLSRPDIGGVTNAPIVFDAWLDDECDKSGLVLVIDDLHWADQTTLDVVHYLVAGPGNRRLAVIATIRSTDVVDTHPLQRWLADIRRLPAVTELRLERLDRVGTRDQIAALVDDSPFESLVDEVFERSRGNPYLTTLLLRSVPPEARHLPARLPGELRDALAHAWRGLSPSARRMTQLLSVIGRPATADEIAQLSGGFGEEIDVVSALHEALESVVVEGAGDEAWWFAHPLMAEMLETDLIPEECRDLHKAAAAKLVKQTPDPDIADPTRIVQIADHYWRAHDDDNAYRWALVAASAVERTGASSEMLRLLRRALDLLPRAGGHETNRQELLDRIRHAAQHAAAAEDELRAVEELQTIVDNGTNPLLASELLVRRAQLKLVTGRQFNDSESLRRAVELASGSPDGAEYAMALAELAHQQLWQADDSGSDTARAAVSAARRSGSQQALSYALTAQVMASTLTITEANPAITADGIRAQQMALEVRDFFAFVHATLWISNSIDFFVSTDVLRVLSQARQAMIAHGAPHPHVAWLAGGEAFGRLERGEIDECHTILRFVLGSNPGPMADTQSRLVAAKLASRQGRRGEADAHLLRADELFAEQSGFLPFEFDAVRAELALANGDHEAAVAAAMAGVESAGVPPTGSETLLPFAAQALADQAQDDRDHRRDDTESRQRIRDLKARHPRTIEDHLFGIAYARIIAAMNAVYDAEVLRGLDSGDAVEAWRRATDLSSEAETPWTEAYASWRAAESGFRWSAGRDDAAASLRRADVLAERLGASPLRARIEGLASSARVSLVHAERPPDGSRWSLSGLTPRERDVVALVVAGRTYAEIGRALFISEKTVSVHVSSLLRKTGTSNRVELAQLASRLATAEPAS